MYLKEQKGATRVYLKRLYLINSYCSEWNEETVEEVCWRVFLPRINIIGIDFLKEVAAAVVVPLTLVQYVLFSNNKCR